MRTDTSQDSPEEKKEQERLLQIVKDVTKVLRQDFDTVQVFTTKHVDDDFGTHNFRYGSGNYFARLGQVKNWILEQNADILSTNEDDE